MRAWIVVTAASVACGPFPGAPPPAPPLQMVQGPPGGDTWSASPEPAPSWSAAPSQAPSPSPSPPSDAQLFVDAHNRDRAKHCAAPLTWSTKLADLAQRWANTLRDKGCAFGHSGGDTGENLAAGTEGMLDPNAVVAMWYDEIKDYSFASGGFSMQTGHFTQVVWRSTKQVGCGHVKCNGNDIYVCEYDPAGNYEGQYRENVLPTTCRK